MNEQLPVMQGIPSLAAYLGDGARADDYEDWVLFIHAQAAKASTPDEAAMCRIINTLTVACVELGRIETDRHGRGFDQVVPHMARAAGIAVMAAVLSAAKDELTRAELESLANVINEDFRRGSMLMAGGQASLAGKS